MNPGDFNDWPLPLDAWLTRLRDGTAFDDLRAAPELRLLRLAGDRRLLLFDRLLLVNSRSERAECLKDILNSMPALSRKQG